MNFKKFIYISILSTSIITLSGCGKESPTISEVFGVYSTVKVCRNIKADESYEKLDPVINLDLMKNESEAGQIVFKMNNDVNSFSVSKTDLSDGRGHYIKSNNISVYMQQYTTLTYCPDQNLSFTSGDEIPDFLLPVDNAVMCNVNNFKGNVYQSFLIDVKSLSTTVPGNYYGYVTFNFDGTYYKTPINATVWDVEFEGHRNFQTSFLLYKGWLIGGEYDTSDELIDTYVDFMTDYKCNTLVVEPNGKIRQEGGMAEYVEKQIKLFDDDNNYSSIPLPIISIPETGYDFTKGRIDNLSDRSIANQHQITTLYFYDFIAALLNKCTNDVNYFPYAYYYLTSFDEMDMYREEGGLYDRGLKFFAKGEGMDLLIDHVITLLKNTGAFSHLTTSVAQEVEKSIRAVPRVVPLTKFDDKIVEDLNLTACPYFSQLDNGLYSSRYEIQRDKNANGYLWTYTCTGPTYPYPTFHLDDYNLGSRTTGWSCKKTKINGYLYYAYNIYDEQNNTFDVGFVDPYTSPIRNANCPGDGYLVYPGKKYGSKSPFPSNRLVCFRDGMDDYDLLDVLEQELAKYSTYYGVNFDFDEIMAPIYDKIITNVKYVENDRYVFEAKKQVLQMISDLKGYDSVFVTKSIANNKIETKIYNKNNNLVVDGTSVGSQPSNKGYVYTRLDNIDQTNKTIAIQTPSVYRDLEISKSGYVNDFSSTDMIYMSEFSSSSVSDGICHVSLNPMTYKDPQETQMAIRSISFANTNIKGKMSNISISMTSKCSIPIELDCTLLSSSNTSVGTLYLYPGQTKVFHFGLGRVKENVLNNVRGVMLKCDNYNDKTESPFDSFVFDINQIAYSF